MKKPPHIYTVEDMMNFLAKKNPKAAIIQASDGEGNWYAPMGATESTHYQVIETERGHEILVGSTRVDEQVAREHGLEFARSLALPKGSPECVVLYPCTL